jgi:hypothetical protein
MNDLTQLMERTTDDLRPNVAGLVSGGMSRGRRLRTRRRAATGLGAVAAAVVVGAVAVGAPSFVDGDARPEMPVASHPTRTTAVNVELPTLRALRDGRVVTLPAGTARLLDSWGSWEEGFIAASWSLTPADGSPAGLVQVLVEYAGPPRSPRQGTAVDLAKATSSSFDQECAEGPGACVQAADGSALMTFTAPEPLSGGGDSDVAATHGSLWTPDGLHVDVTAYNAMAEKGSAPTRTAPVLDEAQLTAMLRGARLG